MEEDLIAFLLADAGLARVFDQRMNWNLRPQGAPLPALVLQLVSAPRQYTYKGRDRLVGHLVQFDVWASTYAAALAGRRALIAATDVLSVAPFQGAFLENERDGSEAGDVPAPGGAASTFHRASLDVRVWHRSST